MAGIKSKWQSILVFMLATTLPFENLWSQNNLQVDIFSQSSFEVWRLQNQYRQSDLGTFTKYLENEKVGEVLPLYQILRTASMAGECHQSAFEIPPQKFWPNIVVTLKFIKTHIVPNIGEVEVVSGYRNPLLNQCAHGARNSAHARFFALDLVPKSQISRKELIASICEIHQKFGPEYNIGLGFYNRTRFHIDSRSYRRWGADGRGKTSPCNDYYPMPPKPKYKPSPYTNL